MKTRYILLFICVLVSACKGQTAHHQSSTLTQNKVVHVKHNNLPTLTFFRHLTGFQNLLIDGSINGAVILGKPFSITIKTDKLTDKNLSTHVKNHILAISLKPYKSKPFNKPEIIVHMPTLNGISITRNAHISLKDLNAKKLRINLNDSSTLVAEGSVEGLTIRINDNASLNAKQLNTQSLHAMLNNNSKVVTNVSKSASIVAKDSSQLTLKGNVHTLSLRAMASANIDASNLTVSNARVVSSDSSHISLHVKHTLIAIASDSSHITYHGKPKVAAITALDNASVIAKV